MRTLDLWTVNLAGYAVQVAAAPDSSLDRIAATARLRLLDDPRGYKPDAWADYVANATVKSLERGGPVSVDERDVAEVVAE